MKKSFVLILSFCFFLFSACTVSAPTPQPLQDPTAVEYPLTMEISEPEPEPELGSDRTPELSVPSATKPESEPIHWPSDNRTLIGRLHSLKLDDGNLLASFYHKETDSFTYFCIRHDTEVLDVDEDLLPWDALEVGTDVSALCTQNGVTPQAISIQLLPILNPLANEELLDLVTGPEAALTGPYCFTLLFACKLTQYKGLHCSVVNTGSQKHGSILTKILYSRIV